MPAAISASTRHLHRYLLAERSTLGQWWSDFLSALRTGWVVGLTTTALAAVLLFNLLLAGTQVLPGWQAVIAVGLVGLTALALALLLAGPLPAQASLRVGKAKLAKALRSGLKVTLRGAQPGRQAIVAKRGKRVVARGTAKVGADGTATVTLRFTKGGKKALRSARSVKLAISGGGAKAAVTLKR